MPRRRQPTPEQLESDRRLVNGCHIILAELLLRYPTHPALLLAVRFTDEFVTDDHRLQPPARKPRARKAKTEEGAPA